MIPENERSLPYRLWIYQRERFPVAGYLPLVSAFTFSAASYSRICRGAEGFLPWTQLIAGIVTSFGLFLLLRLFDEFKDAEEDAEFRPYRPVPRGLISFRELRNLIIGVFAASILLNAFVMPRMLPALGLALVFILVMWREFFVREWLRKHAVAYMVTHMMIMPISDFYTTGLDWMNAQVPMPHGLFLFLTTTFLNGCVIEVGRKIRNPQDEERGVETYSSLWGANRAAVIWLAILSVTAVLAFLCCVSGGYGSYALPLLAACWIGCAMPAVLFLKTGRYAAKIETSAGIWTVCMYMLIGGIPMLIKGLSSLTERIGA